MSNTNRVAIFGAASICGLCIYLPVPGMRGALFCLFPGIANRSLTIAGKGLLAGLAADVAFCIGWIVAGFVWEPRASFNRILAEYLPPAHVVATHFACPVPNGVQFGLGLVGWCGLMFAIWLYLWPRRFPPLTSVFMLLTGAVSVTVASVVLWTVSPMDGWWSDGAKPFGDITSDWYALVFVAAVPVCCLAFGCAIWLADGKHVPTQCLDSRG